MPTREKRIKLMLGPALETRLEAYRKKTGCRANTNAMLRNLLNMALDTLGIMKYTEIVFSEEETVEIMKMLGIDDPNEIGSLVQKYVEKGLEAEGLLPAPDIDSPEADEYYIGYLQHEQNLSEEVKDNED